MCVTTPDFLNTYFGDQTQDFHACRIGSLPTEHVPPSVYLLNCQYQAQTWCTGGYIENSLLSLRDKVKLSSPGPSSLATMTYK